MYRGDGSSLSSTKCLCSQDEVKENLSSLPEHMARVSKTQTMYVSCPALVQPDPIPFPFFVLLAEPLKALSEELQLLLLLCQNFQGRHLKGCFAERLETCIQLQMNWSCPGENLGHRVQILVTHPMEPCSAAGRLGDLAQVTLPLRSPLSCSLPCQRTGTGLLLQYRRETAQRFICTTGSSRCQEQGPVQQLFSLHCPEQPLWEQASTAEHLMECNISCY